MFWQCSASWHRSCLILHGQKFSPTTVTSTTSQDAIQTFVKSDFATRRAMLNQWPASIEQLDQLVAYIDQMSYIPIVQVIPTF